MTHLPIREMVLYKHGVGFFIRAGSVDGTSLDLSFREDDINDILKSLTVFDTAGGKVLGLDYQTPMDKYTRLENTTIRPEENSTLRDLLRDLRGRQVKLGVATSAQPIEGRIIGIELPTQDQFPTVVALLADDEQVHFYPLDTIRQVKILDEQSQQDLNYFLDSSITESKRRNIGVRLSEGEHELVVHYVAPSPTWRVSYRVVAESEKESPLKGKLLLLGWGIFDNHLDEDLEDVKVTLVAGQPISFIYNLYNSQIPERPFIEDESRVAPMPMEFYGMFDDGTSKESPKTQPQQYDSSNIKRLQGIEHMRMRPGMFIGGASNVLPTPVKPTIQDIAATTAISAETSDKGEVFQYKVIIPVSVKRGNSTLVPILSTQIGYEKHLIYNGAKHPRHPITTLHFKNTTGLTLEQGPVTLVENSNYKGEAILPFSKDNQDVYLPFAVELGIRVTEIDSYITQAIGLRFDYGRIIFDDYMILKREYQVESTLNETVTLIIEKPKFLDYSIFDTPPPMVENATERRWQIEIPQQGKQEFTVLERTLHHRIQQIRELGHQELLVFFREKWLDKTTFDTLKGLLDTYAAIERLTKERNELAAQTKAVYQQQEQLRENLKALQTTDAEGQMRNRMLGKLGATQDQLDALEARGKALQNEIETLEKQAQTIIEGLG